MNYFEYVRYSVQSEQELAVSDKTQYVADREEAARDELESNVQLKRTMDDAYDAASEYASFHTSTERRREQFEKDFDARSKAVQTFEMNAVSGLSKEWMRVMLLTELVQNYCPEC